MAYTFVNSQSDVGSYINQDVSDDTKTVTGTEVKRWLNIAYKQMQNALLSANQDYYLQESYADLVASQNDYSLPTDTLKLQRVEIGYESADDRVVADKIELNNMREDAYTGSTQTPYFAVHKNLIRLFPTPPINVTDGLRIFYYPLITELSADGNTYDLPKGYEYLPAYFAAANAKMKLGLFDEASSFMNQFNAGVADMVVEVIERVDDNNTFIQVRQDY